VSSMGSFPPIENADFMAMSFVVTLLGWVAVLGNSFLIWSILSSKCRRVHAKAIYLFCAQALPDVLLGLVLGVFGTFCLVGHRFPGKAFPLHKYGRMLWRGPFCSVYGVLFETVGYASMYTFLLIAWERYTCIVKTSRSQLSSRNTMKLYLCVWILSLTFAVLPFSDDGFILQPPGVTCLSLSGPGFSVALVVSTLLAPVMITSFLYIRIYLYILKTTYHHIPHSNSRVSGAERLIARQFFGLVVVFGMLYLPVAGNFLFVLVGSRHGSFSDSYKLFQGIAWVVAMLNCAINPFLVIFFNKVVKRAALDKFKEFSFFCSFFSVSFGLRRNKNAGKPSNMIVVVPKGMMKSGSSLKAINF